MPIKRNIPGEDGYDPSLPVTAETREYQIWPGGAAYVLVRYVGETIFHDLKVAGPNRADPQAPPVRPDRTIVTEVIRQYKIQLKAAKIAIPEEEEEDGAGAVQEGIKPK